VLGAGADSASHDLHAAGRQNRLRDPDTHATVWNRTADFLMKAYPDRVAEVPTSEYIKGPDF